MRSPFLLAFALLLASYVVQATPFVENEVRQYLIPSSVGEYRVFDFEEDRRNPRGQLRFKLQRTGAFSFFSKSFSVKQLIESAESLRTPITRLICTKRRVGDALTFQMLSDDGSGEIIGEGTVEQIVRPTFKYYRIGFSRFASAPTPNSDMDALDSETDYVLICRARLTSGFGCRKEHHSHNLMDVTYSYGNNPTGQSSQTQFGLKMFQGASEELDLLGLMMFYIYRERGF